MSVSLVTGANKGIGYAIAQQLVDAGHTVYVGAPGFTATDLTGGRGRPVAQSATAILRMAAVGPDGPSGTLQDDDGEMSW